VRRVALFLLVFVSGVAGTLSQPSTKWFTVEDFGRRRSAVMDSIGTGVAVLFGAELPDAFVRFRQDNNFYYLSGVEVPDAVLILDGRTRTSRLVVPEKTPGDIKREARIEPGKEAAEAYGMDRVSSRENLTMIFGQLFDEPRDVYLYLGPEETAEMSPDRSFMLKAKRLDDPWDGRVSKETQRAGLIRDRFPLVTIRDLSPILHEMRWIKDGKEIAVLRECGRIGALGFNEAMKVTRPGLFEYQMVAACDFYYQYNGAQNPAYFAIAASGAQAMDWHYNANNHPMEAGTVVLLDYAPDLDYYVTDITRTWPVNGKFSEDQLNMYACVVEYRKRAIEAMKPGVTYADLIEIGKEVYEEHGYSALWPNYAGHLVGMAVHDVGDRMRAMVPGVVFNLEPIIEDKEKKIHFRLEDTIVITENGAEVLTDLTPVDPAEIEKVIARKGIFEE